MNKLLCMTSFVRVVEKGGFTGAAQSMGMTASAVTKNVRKLETELGAQLLLRTTRHVGLTEFGREYFGTCQRLLDELDSVENALNQKQKSPRGTLRMQCPSFFARAHLLPHLRTFQTRYPEVDVEIFSGTSQENLISTGMDLAVVVGELHNSRLSARVLAKGPRICCAAPAYLKAHGIPGTVDDLAAHDCVTGRMDPWRFMIGNRIVDHLVKARVMTHSGDTLREAALLGYGIVQSNWWLFRNDLRNGALVEVLRPHRVPGHPVSVVHAPTRYLPRKLRVMIDFLVEITRVDGEPA